MGWRDEDTHSFEAKKEFATEKSWLIEMTIPEDGWSRYWLPKKCTIDHNESDGDGNFIFIVNDWWWNKKGDFRAD